MRRGNEQCFTAMGSACSVDVVCAKPARRASLMSYAHVRLIGLEQLWSRFLDNSDVSQINASPGQPVQISPPTSQLLRKSVDAWEATDGAFCPFGEKNMVHAGYDSSFSLLVPKATNLDTRPLGRLTGIAPIVLDEVNQTASIEPGFGIDLGGIAKGFAADLIADELIELGADAAMVDVGGDVACRNAQGHDVVWRIEVEHPQQPDYVVATLDLHHGGVATSSTQRRRWKNLDNTYTHHLLDPRTATALNAGLIGCSVATDQCADAEVMTKVLLSGGLGLCRSTANELLLDIVAVADDGSLNLFGQWAEVTGAA
jgi:FAD:protein FMN transferase